MIATITPNEFAQLICLAAAALLMLSPGFKIHPRLLRMQPVLPGATQARGGREGAKSAKFCNIFPGASRTKRPALPQRPSVLPGCNGTVKILQSAPIITIDIDLKNESVVIIESAGTVKKLQSEEMSRPPPRQCESASQRISESAKEQKSESANQRVSERANQRVSERAKERISESASQRKSRRAKEQISKSAEERIICRKARQTCLTKTTLDLRSVEDHDRPTAADEGHVRPF